MRRSTHGGVRRAREDVVHALRASALTLAALASACAPGAESGEALRVLERDSAGIHVVENPASALERTLAISPEPALAIGSVEGAPEEQLFQVSAAARLSDGTIVVANGGSRELRFYGPDGTHLRTAGGAGQGPSEFGYPVAIVLEPGDTLQVQDRMDRVRFAPNGAFLGRMTTDRGRLQEIAGPGSMTEGGLWLPGGLLFVPAYDRRGFTGPPKAGPPFRPTIRLLRVDPRGQRADTLGAFGGIRQQFVDAGGPRGATVVVPPFGANTWWAQGARDGTLLVADSEQPEVHLFRVDGTHVLVRWPGEREALTAEEVEAWKAEQREASWTRGRLPELERAWAAMDVPDRKAAFGGPVAMGRDGSFWIPESVQPGANPMVFLVFASDGRLRGRATLPGPFRVMDAGPDWVLGIWLDEYQVEFLRIYGVGG